MSARTLVLLRHAKAEAPGDLDDFDRHLTSTGRANADAAGAWLADQQLHPDLVLCSPAVRTRQTWHGVAVALAQASPDSGSPEVHYEQGLYHGGRTEVIDLLRAIPDTVRTVLIVGHNPTVSDVSLLLRPYQETAFTEVFETTGLAVHRAEGRWSATEPGSMPQVSTHTARG
ncbi:histidine phosphatase family protein [Actinoplanes sp. TFC3]|uniref:SixA phosphatase family protein n=1 Tax=Actinoplanes sp. TFC3 TaxID=1710355 RepID=UPI0008378C43|nr:histidine phosphatase family protein [Actinoplanes sp. TFC3]